MNDYGMQITAIHAPVRGLMHSIARRVIGCLAYERAGVAVELPSEGHLDPLLGTSKVQINAGTAATASTGAGSAPLALVANGMVPVGDGGLPYVPLVQATPAAGAQGHIRLSPH